MPADQIVDVDMDADLCVLLQIADMRAIAIGGAIDHAQFAFAHQDRAIADVGIVVYAALEMRRAALIRSNLTNQFEPRYAAAGSPGLACRIGILVYFRDQADDHSAAADDPYEFTYRWLIGVACGGNSCETQVCLCSGDRSDAANQRVARR